MPSTCGGCCRSSLPSRASLRTGPPQATVRSRARWCASRRGTGARPRDASPSARRGIRPSPHPSATPPPGRRSSCSRRTRAADAALDVALPPANWSAIGGDPARGWRYVDEAGSAGGVRKIVVKPGRRGGKITVKAKGAAFPCATSAPQHTPFEVSLRLGAERYCASFGGTIVRNVAGTFTAKASPAPLTCAGAGVRVATLNVLHGLFCPSGTANCRLSDRIALLGQWILERKCPDVIALQEVWSSSPGVDVLSNVQAQLVGICPDDYRVAFQQTFVADDSVILSRYAVVSNQSSDLYGPFRYVQHARLDHPVGLLDVFSTHLASGSTSPPRRAAPSRPARRSASPQAPPRFASARRSSSRATWPPRTTSMRRPSSSATSTLNPARSNTTSSSPAWAPSTPSWLPGMRSAFRRRVRVARPGGSTTR